ncbi:MAG: sulfite exporter TauE/SafE family protein [Candidatus Heimdallarchaeota archaeon]|nr:sulfite exporter TauE/SafE family protein [Candidatus Heimdallarchaeota archaeon]
MIAIALYKMSMITRDWINKRRGILQEEEDCMELECDEEQKNRPWWKQTVFYRDFEDKRGIKFKYRAKLLPGIFIAIVGGFIGAVLGLGGGVIYVPILTMALGMPAPIATATSTFTILFATPFAVLTRSLDLFGAGAVSIQWDIVLLMAAGAVITANIIPRFLHKVKSEAILVGFWSLASFAAVRVLLKALDVIDW